MHIYIYTYMYTYTYMCIYIYIYIYITLYCLSRIQIQHHRVKCSLPPSLICDYFSNSEKPGSYLLRDTFWLTTVYLQSNLRIATHISMLLLETYLFSIQSRYCFLKLLKIAYSVVLNIMLIVRFIYYCWYFIFSFPTSRLILIAHLFWAILMACEIWLWF